jgi:SAM-dependent methyltransferase
MLDRLEEIIAERPEIETLLYILGRDRILEWVHSVGVSTDPQMRALAPSVPPQELRSIVAAPSEPVFLWSGLKDAEMCATNLERYGKRETGTRTRILDFGCGCGRTARFLQAIPQFAVYGTDVNVDLVTWCQENLPRVTTTANGASPPLSFGDGQIDFVYSLSIFTHLPEPSMLAWLDELARVTADHGIVLLTTHGHIALEIICQSVQHQQMFQMSRAEAEGLRSTFDQKRFVYRGYSSDIMEAAKAGEDYGNSFTHQAYIAERWLRGVFDVLEFLPGGLRGWQDVTILRRRARSEPVRA